MSLKVRKVAILGSRAVGKSSVTVQFVENHFAETYYPTIENVFTKNLKYKGEEYQIEIADTAGQDEFSILNSKHAIGIHGYVLVYSIASRQSFEMISILRDKILNFTGMEWLPIVIVANKVDLHPQRQVSTEEGQNLAKEWKCAFIETR
jgi:Ras homolog enriched in brain